MLTYWMTFASLGAGGATVCIRYMMIESAMVSELMKLDPDFRPKYMPSFNPADRTYNVREYRRRLPNSPLGKKLNHTLWAFGAWAVLGIAWISNSSSFPR